MELCSSLDAVSVSSDVTFSRLHSDVTFSRLPSDLHKKIASQMPLEARIRYNSCLEFEDRYFQKLNPTAMVSHHLQQIVDRLRSMVDRSYAARFIGNLHEQVRIQEKMYFFIANSTDPIWQIFPPKLQEKMLISIENIIESIASIQEAGTRLRVHLLMKYMSKAQVKINALLQRSREDPDQQALQKCRHQIEDYQKSIV